MNQIWQLHTRLAAEQKILDSEILKTPTSPKRELLTQANINLMIALDQLAEAAVRG